MNSRDLSSGTFPSPIQNFIQGLHDKYARLEDGKVADYIPELSHANPEWFGISVATVDGQIHDVGHSSVPFTIQSISKPLVYGLALESHGLKPVQAKVGVEPSGDAFNSISLDPQTGRPLNPMINAGAIATTSLIPGESAEAREAMLLRRFSEIAGRNLEIDDAVYRSERDTGHRNRAIAHLLRNAGILTDDPEQPLDLYFRQCSIQVTCHDLAVIAATLASGGVNPVTRQRVLAPLTVGRLLSVMTSCGMYDFAGGWIFNVGMPAKSGVSGGIMAVLPGQLGVAVFSPPLDARGNSVRGIRVCTDLSMAFGLHMFNTPRVVIPALRNIRNGGAVRSRRLRTTEQLATLTREGHGIRLYEFGGRLIFASTELAIHAILADLPNATHAIIDLSRVIDVDQASCKLLLELHDQLAARLKRACLAGARQHALLREYVTTRMTEDGWNHLCRYADRDAALEAFEDDLLKLRPNATRITEVPRLEDQELLKGFGAAELQALQEWLRPVEWPAHQVIMASGSASDALYFIVEGEVSVWVGAEGSEVQVGRLGPGMSVGELALTDRAPRSATVRSLTPVRAWALPFDAYDRLSEMGQSGLQIRLLGNLTRVLAVRLRAANAEIRGLS
ncbi:MAG: glutaminase A [Verrucomicrobiales bacterium]|nr:glutaminase A [Verrucomicrobiales bacterium]